MVCPSASSFNRTILLLVIAIPLVRATPQEWTGEPDRGAAELEQEWAEIQHPTPETGIRGIFRFALEASAAYRWTTATPSGDSPMRHTKLLVRSSLLLRRQLRRLAQRLDHAAIVRDALAGNVERRAVITEVRITGSPTVMFTPDRAPAP